MRLPDLDLDLIRCFVSVVETGGFTPASKSLHLTQSAVTLKIKRLEDLLQVRLFRKTVPPLELTLEGEVVLGYAFRLLALNREMVLRVSQPDSPVTLRLGVISHFGYELLPQWLAKFKKAWPKTRVVMDMGMNADLLKGLEEERFDLVIAAAGHTGLSQYKNAPILQEQFLQKEKLHWVRAENSKIDLQKDPLPLVMFGPQCRYRPLCLDSLQKAGRTWEITYDGGSLQAVQSAVEADLGLTVLSSLSLKPGLEIVGKKADLPVLPSSDLVLYTRKNSGNPEIQKLSDFITGQVSDWEKNSKKRAGALG